MRLRHALALLCCLALAVPTAATAMPPEPEPPIRVLVYSATYGFRHGSITTARNQFAKLGESPEFDVTLTEDPAMISAEGLAGHDVVAFVNATGEHPFSPSQRNDLLAWMAQGKGFVATHASIDGNYYWSDYGEIVGAYFLAHPHTGSAVNVVEDKTSPFTAHFGTDRYTLNEEYYRFQLNPRDNVHVLTSLDRSTAGSTGQSYEEAQPTTYCHDVAGGRAFVTAWGHFDASFTNTIVWQMLTQGVRWAAGRIEADCSPTVPVPAGRLDAEDAAQIAFARKGSSTEKGAEQVVTEILHEGYLKFPKVDLTGKTKLRARVSVETVPLPRPYHVPVAQPAAGGTIALKLDSLRVGNTGSATPATATIAVSASAPGWKTLEVNLPAGLTGERDVYFLFTETLSGLLATSRIVAPEVTDSRYLMSVDWFELS